MTAKPLTMEELRHVKLACERYRRAHNARWVDCDVITENFEALLATIRRRDELIRWLVEYHALGSALNVLRHTRHEMFGDDRVNATDVLAIVEAGD